MHRNFKRYGMRYNSVSCVVIVLCTVLTFSSCGKVLIDDEEMPPSVIADQEYGSARLNIVTHAESDSDGNVIGEGRIYIFNSSGKCIQLLSTDETTNQATALLSAGSYTLYAVGGGDLSRFSLPKQNEATPTSVIKCIEGMVMDDILMASANVDLEDGETVSQNMALEHKVLCVDEIEIREVPLPATKVEVSISPLYSSVQLDGTYPSSFTESYKIALTKQDDGKTWKALPHQMLLPSKGKPTIKVSITTDEGVMGYSYNATEELPANHHFTIIGTYKAAQGVSLTGILTDSGWGEDRVISFDIGDESQFISNPVEGQFANGYYVVTVNESNRSAVLLSQTQVDYEAPSAGATSDMWKQAFVAPMAALEKPFCVSCGNWRLPTKAEAEKFIVDPSAIYYATSGSSITIYCLDGNTLCWINNTKEPNGNYAIKSGSNVAHFSAGIYLRPVIDITY